MLDPKTLLIDLSMKVPGPKNMVMCDGICYVKAPRKFPI